MNNLFEVTIEKLIPGGKGLCHLGGKVVFVPYVLPGELVEVSIIEERRNFSEAKLERLIQTSPDRIEPKCPHYYKCGGCNLQHMNYLAQLRVKSEFAENLLLRNGKITFSHIKIVPSEPFAYRNRIQIHFNHKIKGFKERNSNNIIPINNCPIATKGINTYLDSEYSETDNDRITVFGENDWFSVENSGEEISITLNNKKVFFKSNLFFQSNVSILPELSDYLNLNVKGGTLLDLYCGVGLLSSMVEEKFEKIFAVEINRDVSPYIKKNLKTNCEFYPLSLEKWIAKKKNIKVDTIIIDPPRTGLTKIVRKFLNTSNAGVIIYVSCDPATMARDLQELIADNYTIDDFKLFDFYPQTSHMEAVAVLRQRS